VHGAMLIEPTESQAKEDIDLFIAAMRSLAERARSGTAVEDFKAAPRLAPRRRLDETLAARKPILRWRPSNNPPDDPMKQAAD
jgi:glycine dehydrogenase subunit 2